MNIVPITKKEGDKGGKKPRRGSTEKETEKLGDYTENTQGKSKIPSQAERHTSTTRFDQNHGEQ